MTDDTLRPARRFLHVCYCCSDNTAPTAFFVDNFAMRNTMSSPPEPSDGAILGLDGDVVSGAAFVYDPRGPRTSPAIEVQAWIDPPLVGAPIDDPTQVGIQALGFAVPAVEELRERLVALGCTVAGDGASAFGPRWCTIRDVRGVTIDLVEDASVPAGETRMRHLRINCTDLNASMAWYEGLGFDVVDKASIIDATFLGVDPPTVDAQAVRLRLPDEPFEAILVEWRAPRAHGRHVSEPNHAGLFRTAIGVDDTRASFDAMSAAGWSFDRAPMPIVLTGTPVPEMWICFISDPDGVPFEFVERPRSAFR
jgi:catechol 2,3-dioxygenase-like lactoylglutathione lyase family enzyme